MPIDASDVHRGQFVMTCSNVSPQAEWKTLSLGRGWPLHHHPHVELASAEDGSALIGSATQLLAERPAPIDALSRPAFTLREADTWAGRWVIVKGGLVASDASALLGLFFGETKQGPCVSSSLAVVAELNGDTTLPDHAAMKGWGLDWVPAPRTILPGISRLLPGQTLLLNDQHVTFGDRAPALAPSGLSPVEAASAFAAALAQGLRTFGDGYLLPLTAGLDSRTVLAALLHAHQPFAAFTHSHKAMSHGDRAIPPQLAHASGFEHIPISDAAYAPEAEAAVDVHSHGQLYQNRHFFAHDHYAALASHRHRTMLPGGCFEVGRCYYWSSLPADLPANTEAAVDAILQGLNAGDVGPLLRDGIRTWLLDLRSRDQNTGACGWRDIFYLEQRLAGWLATTEQATDLNGIRKLHIANSRYIYELMLAFPPEERRIGAIQRGAIEKMKPELLRLPVNPPPPLRARIKGKIGGLLRRYGLR